MALKIFISCLWYVTVKVRVFAFPSWITNKASLLYPFYSRESVGRAKFSFKFPTTSQYRQISSCIPLKGGDSLYQTELGAYLRSLGLSVGKKLCFFLCAYMGLSSCAIIDLSCNCFLSCYARDEGFSQMYTESWKQLLSCSVKTFFWGGVGGVSAIH